MVSRSYQAEVPGSLMLLGEHAVLRGKHAVVVAINQYLRVVLTPRVDRTIKLSSPIFGVYQTSMDKLQLVKPYQYVLAAIIQLAAGLPAGFDLEITSDFASDIGFGSSAAVTVATLGVLNFWLAKRPLALRKLYQQAVTVIRTVQGVGSGADVAASVWGGIVHYRAHPFKINLLPGSLPLVAVYSGSKLATPLVIKQVAKLGESFPKIFRQLDLAIDHCSQMGAQAILAQDWRQLGQVMNIHQGLQDALGVNSPILAELVFALRARDGIYGAKISGSGLGDCVVGLGEYFQQSAISAGDPSWESTEGGVVGIQRQSEPVSNNSENLVAKGSDGGDFPENAAQRQLGVREFILKGSERGITCFYGDSPVHTKGMGGRISG